MGTIFVKEGTVLPARREHDLYETPEYAVRQAIQLVNDDFSEQGDWPPRRVLDIGAGNGVWGEVARSFWPDATIIGVEIRDTPKNDCYDYWLKGDFFDWLGRLQMLERFDLITGNLPFGIVEKIIDRCWYLLRLPIDAEIFQPGGRLGLFLRLAFLEGQTRRDNLYRQCPLKKLGVYSKRVSFSENGKTNATAHAFFLWQLGYRDSDFLRFF